MAGNNHPNIVKFLDYIKDSNTLIMEVYYFKNLNYKYIQFPFVY